MAQLQSGMAQHVLDGNPEKVGNLLRLAQLHGPAALQHQRDGGWVEPHKACHFPLAFIGSFQGIAKELVVDF